MSLAGTEILRQKRSVRIHVGLALAMLVASPGVCTGRTYYVDSLGGNDRNDALAPERAWRSLERVNATIFTAGDRIALRAGSVWDGVSLRPLGSGTPAAPILLG